MFLKKNLDYSLIPVLLQCLIGPIKELPPGTQLCLNTVMWVWSSQDSFSVGEEMIPCGLVNFDTCGPFTPLLQLSMHQSMGHTPGGTSPLLPYDTKPRGPSGASLGACPLPNPSTFMQDLLTYKSHGHLGLLHSRLFLKETT